MKHEINTYVHCINNDEVTGQLTKGKPYLIIKIDTGMHFVIDDKGREYGFFSNRFGQIKPEVKWG